MSVRCERFLRSYGCSVSYLLAAVVFIGSGAALLHFQRQLLQEKISAGIDQVGEVALSLRAKSASELTRSRVRPPDSIVSLPDHMKHARQDGGDTGPTGNRANFDRFNLAERTHINCRGLKSLHRPSAWQWKVLVRHLIYSDEHRMIYCSVPKTGSSSWKRVMHALNSKGKVPVVHFKNLSSSSWGSFKTMDHLSKEAVTERLDRYFKFMFVRNPADRIAAVYSHKFTDFPESRPFKRKFGPIILRKESSRQVPYLDKEEYELKDDPTYEGRHVSMDDFARYLGHVSVSKMNEHWMPAYQLCQPCSVQYDFVGRFEDLPQSADAVLEYRQLSNTVTYPQQTMFYRSPPMQHNDALSLLAQLVPLVRHKLFLIYGYDFAIFSYHVPSMQL